MVKYLFLLLLTTITTSTSTPICTLSPKPSPTSAPAPASTPNISNIFAPTAVPSPTTSTTLTPTFASTATPSPTTTIPTPTPSAPTPINKTTATSTTLTPPPSSAPTPIPSSSTTLTPTSAPSLAPTPTSSSNTTTFSVPPTPPSPLKPQHEDIKFALQEQIYNIIDAVLGAGDFKNWADVFTMADPTSFPISATFFIPSDNSLSPMTTTADPYIFPYHIVPQRLSFDDLHQFKAFSRLPTLLLDKSILITNNSASNFTLDGSRLTHPDIYANAAIAVHGLDNLLNYSVYGAEAGKNPSKPNMVVPRPIPASPPPPTPPRVYVPSTADDEELTVHPYGESDAACLCTEVWTVFLILCVFLASKFQRMVLVH